MIETEETTARCLFDLTGPEVYLLMRLLRVELAVIPQGHLTLGLNVFQPPLFGLNQ